MITKEQLAELRAAASTAHNDIIRSHGWDGFVSELDALAKDEAFLLLASPETMLALLDHIDAQATELAAVIAEWDDNKETLSTTLDLCFALIQTFNRLHRDAAERYAALRHALINVDPKGNRGPIEMAIKNLVRQVHAERGETEPTETEFDAAIDAAMSSQAATERP
ncbi:hypothetical protein JOS77_30915 [Chromobacterium haemolyticum]|nr:hypothetical protein JOS77_30915 [Chromobacterium haemolyticum]